MAKIRGCRVVGVAGGPEKCDFAVGTLGFDACLDHRAPDLPQQMKAAVPEGIDVYFESVGGAVLAAVVPLLNVGARIPLCGLIAWYNLDKLPAGPDRTPQLLVTLLKNRVKLQGFIVFDHYERRGAFLRDMTGWLSEGKVKYREHMIEGLEHAPQGLMGLLEGENFGKVVVHVADP
jgi:NADPH-dependent curcumin reductase CurA